MSTHLAAVAIAVLALASPVLAKPPTVQERTAAQHERQVAARARAREQTAERARERDAKRSANDLGLTGRAKQRYVELNKR